jgi:hypothetical protein
MTVALDITMLVAGQPFERREPMLDIETCWREARVRMEAMRGKVHDGAKITRIGIGCVIDTGAPV